MVENKVDKVIDENDDGMWVGREFYNQVKDIINTIKNNLIF